MTGWQIVDRGEAAKAAAEKDVNDDAKPQNKRTKRRSHDDKLG